MNGCTESCPCRRWTQCHKYNNYKWKQQYSNDHIAIINEWYRNNFKLRYDCPESFPNG